MVWPFALGALCVVLVVLLRFRPGSEPGRIGVAVAFIVLAILTSVALISSRQPSAPRAGASDTPVASASPGVSAGASAPASGGATPAPVLLRYEVAVEPGAYRVFQVEADGTITDGTSTTFDGSSWAPVDRVEASNGLVHWRIVVGGLTGQSFVPDRSGPFRIREVLRAADGSLVYEEIPAGG